MHVWFQLYKKYYIADCPLFPQSYSSCSVFMIAFFEHPWFWNFGSFYYLIYACSVSIIELFLAMEEKKGQTQCWRLPHEWALGKE